MKIIAGIDIGNATTEVALARVTDSEIKFLGSSLYKTKGLKGTEENFLIVRKIRF